MLAGIKIKPCIPSHFSNNPCLNKLPRSGKPSYVASSWHTHTRARKKIPYCRVWLEIVAVTSFKKSLLFASLERGLGLCELHLHACGDPIGSAQRYSPRQSDGVRCACQWSSPSGVQASGDAENMPSLLHPNPIETSECFSKAAGANEKQMLNFQGIRMHFFFPDRCIG